MRRRAALCLVAIISLSPESAAAKGGYVRVPEPKPMAAGLPPPDIELLPKQILGGCGPKRYRDLIIRKCRGPADSD
jgi:hypothetical protein